MNWVEHDRVLAFHTRVIAISGGGDGLRDESALLAGLHRAQNLHAYGDPPPDIADLAAVYAGGIVLNHPFIDGNKRTGFVVAATFIEDNGYDFVADEADATLWTLKLAARACEESDYADWLRANMKKRKKTPAFKYPKTKTAPKKKAK